MKTKNKEALVGLKRADPQGNRSETGDEKSKKLFWIIPRLSISARLLLPSQFNWKSKPFEDSLIQKILSTLVTCKYAKSFPAAVFLPKSTAADLLER